MKIATFVDLEKADGIEYVDVEAYGLLLRLGSLSSGDIIKWNESKGDESKAREAGMRLLVMSIVEGADHHRVPDHDVERWLEVFRRKSERYNSLVIQKVLDLNGLEVTE